VSRELPWCQPHNSLPLFGTRRTHQKQLVLAVNLIRIDLILRLARESRKIPVGIAAVAERIAGAVAGVVQPDAAFGHDAVGRVSMHALRLVDVLAQVLARLAGLAGPVMDLSLVVLLVVELHAPGVREGESEEDGRADDADLHGDGFGSCLL